MNLIEHNPKGCFKNFHYNIKKEIYGSNNIINKTVGNVAFEKSLHPNIESVL